MLNSDFQAKLGDFGLARVIENGHTSHFTSPGGTRGYLAPESVISGITSVETYVFSFGVVAPLNSLWKASFRRERSRAA